jgi:NADH:ubiquinone oxidoreductase subunit D
MRDLLEQLPHALLPDPTKESEDPGLRHDVHDDDLVRPFAEEDLPIDASRSRRSPLARHVDVVVQPFDPRLPTPVGLTLAVEGQRVRSAAVDIGMLHQGIERRAIGLDARGVALAELVAVVEPATLWGLSIAIAVERLNGVEPGPSTRWWRQTIVDLVACASHARVLADVLRREPALSQRARQVAFAADVARHGLEFEHRFACAGGLRSHVPEEERLTMRRRIEELGRVAALWSDDDVEDATRWLQGSGALDANRCREWGIDGPAAAACGASPVLPADLGEWLGLLTPKSSGCAFARVVVRLAELRACVTRLLDRAAQAPPVDDDDHADTRPWSGVEGVASALIRGPGGTMVVQVGLAASGAVRHLRLRPPDLPVLAGAIRALRGVRLDDVTEVLSSFGLRASALDR